MSARYDAALIIAEAADKYREVAEESPPTTQHYAAAEALLAAGYRKPRIITTLEGLDALPDGSVVLDPDGDVGRKVRGGWAIIFFESGEWFTDNVEDVDIPTTVLWEPEA